jgi:hypothetical protein
MTTTMTRDGCQAGPLCDRTICFQARLDGRDGSLSVTRSVKLCGVHLGDAVQGLADWAREHGITHGRVTVLIIDPPPYGPPGIPLPRAPVPGGFAFGNIPLGR